MPETLIIYYSRTGTTRTLAEAVAQHLSADTCEIQVGDRYLGGPFGYLRAGYDSLKGVSPPLVMPEVNFANYDLIVLGTPIWTSYPSAPMRSFLSSKPDLTQRVALLLSYGGHSPPEKAVKVIEELLSVPLEAVCSVQEGKHESETASLKLKEFAETLLQRDAR